MASGFEDMRVQGVCLTATTPLLVFENLLSQMRQPWVQAVLRKRNIFICLSLHRCFRKVPDRENPGLWDRREAGFDLFHTYPREFKTDSELLQMSPREFLQGFIFAQKFRTSTQLHVT